MWAKPKLKYGTHVAAASKHLLVGIAAPFQSHARRRPHVCDGPLDRSSNSGVRVLCPQHPACHAHHWLPAGLLKKADMIFARASHDVEKSSNQIHRQKRWTLGSDFKMQRKEIW
jgi:hypothetical protein